MIEFIKYLKNIVLFVLGIILLPFVFFDMAIIHVFKLQYAIRKRIRNYFEDESI